MFKRRDDIKTFVVIAVVCVICVIVILLFNRKSNYDKLEVVNEYNVFYSNVNYIDNYINAIASYDSISVYNLLDEEYIKDNNITLNNVLDNVDEFSDFTSVNVEEMYFVQVKDDYIYYIKGQIYENHYDESVLVDDNFIIIIKKDINNRSYSIYPVDDNYKSVINSIKKINIKHNTDNTISDNVNISKEQMCITYLSDFVNRLYNDTSNTYNLLTDSMKEKYPDSNSYMKYITDNMDIISSAADKCALDEYKDERVYTVIDINGNRFVFEEESIMNYKVNFYLKSE